MSAIKDGGPAFPIPMLPGEIWSHELYGSPNGMTLRDWFAGNERIYEDESFSWELCEALAGKRPDKDRRTDPVSWEIWQATWQAKIKFIRADAMIAAREGKGDK